MNTTWYLVREKTYKSEILGRKLEINGAYEKKKTELPTIVLGDISGLSFSFSGDSSNDSCWHKAKKHVVYTRLRLSIRRLHLSVNRGSLTGMEDFPSRYVIYSTLFFEQSTHFKI